MQVSGLQIVVDQAAIAKALPLAPGTRMALPLLIHAPQVLLPLHLDGVPAASVHGRTQCVPFCTCHRVCINCITMVQQHTNAISVLF